MGTPTNKNLASLPYENPFEKLGYVGYYLRRDFCDPLSQSCLSIDNSNSSEVENMPNPTKAYAYSRLGNQFLNPLFRMASNRIKMEGLYRFNDALSDGNSFKEVFSGNAGMIYRQDNVIGKTFHRAFVPAKFGDKPYAPKQRSELFHSGQRLIKYSQRGTIALNGAWLAIDIYALKECVDNDCSNIEIGAIAFEAGRVSTDLLSTHFYNIGISRSQVGNYGNAYRVLLDSKNYLKHFGTLRAISGGLRFAVEVENYVETDDFNGAAMAYGASDVVGGYVQYKFAKYMISAADVKLTSSGVKAANSVLISDAVQLSTKMARLRVVGGAAGAIAGIGINAYSIGSSLIREDITPEQKSKNIKSGLIGILGNGVFLYAALTMVATPLAPISIGLFIAGSAILIGQSIYDHYNEFDGSLNDTYVQNAQIASTPTYVDYNPDLGSKEIMIGMQSFYNPLDMEIETQSFYNPFDLAVGIQNDYSPVGMTN